MPWKAGDAKGHNSKAATPRLQRMWADVANAELKKHGDDGRAIREANAAVDRELGRHRPAGAGSRFLHGD